ncbi:unnamed protein product [Clonostachys chloroleuca]|uniref:Uncharacterized protein n=1 Tax=Clonostachys chloroleuca TaxID=1926264 RepID=A0AA35PTD1_9HYPO|nr:unnamed protein product [Clonostachys chloroleuca]
MDYPKENVIEHPPSYPDLYNIDSDREAWGGVVPPTQTWGNADKAPVKPPFRQRVRRFFTKPRTWSRKKQWIVGICLLLLLIVIIAVPAGVAAGTRSRTCECPGWTSGDGVVFGPTYYNCDSDGNDLTTGKSNEDACEV